MNAEEEEANAHRHQTRERDTGGCDDHACQCDDKTVKGEAKQDKVPWTTFGILQFSVHLVSARGQPVEPYTSLRGKTTVIETVGGRKGRKTLMYKKKRYPRKEDTFWDSLVVELAQALLVSWRRRAKNPKASFRFSSVCAKAGQSDG